MIFRLVDALKRLVADLPDGSSRFMVAYAVATSLLSLLDVAALGILALVLTPMVQGSTITAPLLGQIGPSQYPWFLVGAGALMILKAILALVIQWFATRRFAAFELEVSDRLFQAYIRAPWLDRLSRSTSQIVRMADVGVANTIIGVVIPALNIPQLICTFLAVLLVLVVAKPLIALITLLYLGLVAAFLYFVVSPRAVEAGQVNLRVSMKITKLMTEMVSTLKEITLRDKFSEVAAVVRENRKDSTRARANAQFLGTVPQRVLEAGLVGGFLIVGIAAYLTQGTEAVFTSIALFGIAGFRIVPSIVNFQAVINTSANNLPHLEEVLRDIHAADQYQRNAEVVGRQPLPDRPRRLRLQDVTFTYPDAPQPAVRDVSLDVPIGSSVGFVGASGSGKSTLIDLLLGLLVPQEGTIDIDGRPLEDVLAAWRSRAGYVPQEVALFDATIAQNIALTWGDDIDMDRVRRAVDRAQLSDMVAERPGGLDAVIGERGIALSGGQRQRLGIARALYTDPLVLVLDEATSALDTATEDAVSEAIRQLHGQVTVVTVAHRLSTIRHNDQVCFMRDGRITARGTFDELVEREPDFAVQAHLAGLI